MQMIGYIKKVSKSTGEIIGYTSYSEMILDSGKRVRLRKELADNDIELYCACSDCNDKPVLLNEQGAFQFPPGIPHARACLEQLKCLRESFSKTAVGFFRGAGAPIPVSFKWTKGSRRGLTAIRDGGALAGLKAGRVDLSSYISLFNMITFSKIAASPQRAPRGDAGEFLSSFLAQLRFDIGMQALEDVDGNQFLITNNRFLTPFSNVGETYFFYGRMVSYNDSYQKNVYLTCETQGRTLSICVPVEMWEPVRDFCESENYKGVPLWLSGFVDVRMKKIMVKGKYDSITKSAYGGGTKERKEFSLKNGVLFHCNHYGLICCSKEECEGGERAIQMGYGLEKPFAPVIQTAPDGSLKPVYPALVARTMDGDVFYL